METIKSALYHRMTRHLLTDSVVEGVNVSGTTRPITFASAASVALAAIAAGIANAAPATPQSEPQSTDPNMTTVAAGNVTAVEVSDIEWTAEEDVTTSVTTEAPTSAPATVTPAADQSDPVVSRSKTRPDATSDISARQVILNVAGDDIAPVALGLIGIPYVCGGEILGGLDCSGLIRCAYAAAGTNLSHSPSARAAGDIIVSDPQSGDIVSHPGHVAIYIGGNQMVEAAVPGRLFQISPVHPGATYVRY